MRGLQNPRIMDKKFNLGQASNGPKQLLSGESSNQTSQRYILKDNLDNSILNG
jgi:hypothetical protein